MQWLEEGGGIFTSFAKWTWFLTADWRRLKPGAKDGGVQTLIKKMKSAEIRG